MSQNPICNRGHTKVSRSGVGSGNNDGDTVNSLIALPRDCLNASAVLLDERGSKVSAEGGVVEPSVLRVNECEIVVSMMSEKKSARSLQSLNKT